MYKDLLTDIFNNRILGEATMEEIAKRNGVSRARVGQSEKILKNRLFETMLLWPPIDYPHTEKKRV